MTPLETTKPNFLTLPGRSIELMSYIYRMTAVRFGSFRFSGHQLNRGSVQTGSAQNRIVRFLFRTGSGTTAVRFRPVPYTEAMQRRFMNRYMQEPVHEPSDALAIGSLAGRPAGWLAGRLAGRPLSIFPVVQRYQVLIKV